MCYVDQMWTCILSTLDMNKLPCHLHVKGPNELNVDYVDKQKRNMLK
jgi:hypothetical protein